MKQIDVMIATYSGRESKVSAEQFGPFAIHRTWNGEAFSVTHIKTGFAVEMYIESREAAIALARKLSAARLNWAFRNPERIPTRTNTSAKRLLEAWRESQKRVRVP